MGPLASEGLREDGAGVGTLVLAALLTRGVLSIDPSLAGVADGNGELVVFIGSVLAVFVLLTTVHAVRAPIGRWA